MTIIGSKRHRDALLIVDPGACNPSGVALSIHEACKEIFAEGGGTSGCRNDPAVRLMVYQLAYLCGSAEIDLDTAAYGRLVNECKAKLQED